MRGTHSKVLLSLCAFSIVGAAQEPADTVQLEPLVVTATRLPMSRRATSSNVTVISGETIRARGIDHVLDALRTEAGLAIVQTGSFGGTTSLFLRGGESDYVQVLVDGVQVNQAGGFFDFGTMSTDNIDRIEVVRGPASALYGSDAMTGVIQIFTRPGTGGPRASADAQGGTYDSWRWGGTLSGGTDEANYSLSLSRITSDGSYDFNNDYENTSFSGLVAFRPTSNTDARLSLRYSDNQFNFPTDGSGQLVDANAFRFGDVLSLAVDLGHRFTDRVEGRVLLTANEVDAGTVDDPDGTADTVGFFATRSLNDERRVSADARVNVLVGSSTSVTGGVELEQETERTFNEFRSDFGDGGGNTDIERWNRAAYGQAVTTWSGVSFTGGARIEDNEAFGTNATVRFGGAYDVAASGTRLHGSFGTGIKEPTFFENFATGFTLGNPNLDPERTSSWEFGVEQRLLRGVEIGVTYFDQTFSDLIQFTFAPPKPGDPNFFNIAKASARGLEFRSTAVWGVVSGSLAYTYLDTEVLDPGFDVGANATFVDGDRLLRRPTHQFSAVAQVQPIAGGALTATLHVVGDRDDLFFAPGAFEGERSELPAYGTLDLAGQMRLRDPTGRVPGVELTARVENLFNEVYEPVRGFPARGRSIFFGSRVLFGTGR